MRPFYHPITPLSSPSATSIYTPSNEQAAWLAMAYTAASIHGNIAEEAREALCQLLAAKQLYRGHEMVEYFQEIWRVKDQVPPREIIRVAARQVKPENAPTLFCIITDILLTKGYLTPLEANLLDYISVMLSLDDQTASTILHVLQVKNKGNCID